MQLYNLKLNSFMYLFQKFLFLFLFDDYLLVIQENINPLFYIFEIQCQSAVNNLSKLKDICDVLINRLIKSSIFTAALTQVQRTAAIMQKIVFIHSHRNNFAIGIFIFEFVLQALKCELR